VTVTASTFTGPTETICTDSVDNDCDGKVDMADIADCVANVNGNVTDENLTVLPPALCLSFSGIPVVGALPGSYPIPPGISTIPRHPWGLGMIRPPSFGQRNANIATSVANGPLWPHDTPALSTDSQRQATAS
jgi:hypothetical protein